MEETTTDLELLTLKEVCRILKVSRRTGYKTCRQWGLRFLRFGGCVRVIRAEFEEALKKNLHFF